MKKIFLAIIIFFIGLNTYSQHDYVPMAVENATYLLYTGDYDFLPPWEDYYFGYKINGDIEIDGTWYKKVYYRKYYSVYPNSGPAEPPLFLGDEYLIGAIRDDIPNKKVFAYLFEEPYYQLTNYYACELNTEFLLFDFNMNLGDFFTNFCIVQDGYLAELDNIQDEYIYFANRFVYNLQLGALDWGIIYEGIGSDSGLFDPVWGHFEAPYTSLLVYCVGEDEDCLVDYLLADDEYSLTNSILVYPNPVEEIIHITFLQDISLRSIQVYDLCGKLLIRETNNLEKIDSSDLTDGLYMIQATTDFGIIYKKIVKKSSM